MARAALIASLVLLTGAPAGAAVEGGPPARAGDYLASRHAQHLNDWRTAAERLKGILAQGEEDLTVLRRAFILMLGDGQIDEALALAQRLHGTRGEHPSSVALLTAEAVRTGAAPSSSPPPYAQLASDGLNQVLRPLLDAWFQAARGDATAARKALLPLEKVAGFGALYTLHAATLAERAGDTTAAEKGYRALLEPEASLRAMVALVDFLRRHDPPQPVEPLLEHWKTRHGDEGPTDIAILQQRPVPPLPEPQEGLALAFYDLAHLMMQDGASELALLYNRLALYLHPRLPMAQLLMADILLEREQWELALPLYRELAADPLLGWPARLRLAETLGEHRQGDEARTLLTAMAAERPDRIDVLTREGDLLRRTRQYEAAVQAYAQAISRLKPPLQSRHWGLYYARGMCYERLNRWPEAEADLQQALSLSPDQPYVLNYLGYSWMDRGLHYEKARTMVEKAAALRPDDGHILDSLGWVLYLQGALPEAVATLERAAELSPLDSTINEHLGDAYWRSNRKDEARYQWERALSNADPEEDQERLPGLRARLEKGLPATLGAKP